MTFLFLLSASDSLELMFFLNVMVLIIIFLLALILLAPIAVAFNVDGGLSGVRSNVSVKWMFLSHSFSGKPGTKAVPVTNGTILTGEGIPKGGTRHPLENMYEMAKKGYGIKGQFIHLMKGLLFQLQIRDLAFDLTYGLPDPADTGMVCGYLHTLASIVRGRARSFSYSLYPVFMEEAFDVHLSGSIRFRIGSFIPPLLMFIFNVKVLKTGWWFAKNRYSSGSVSGA
ncbi:MAG: DUF2953 domain-containing protein [Methanococcoides sp.]|nr:DUF2953 domain-containing protein [Methanococcoides sp.]